MAEKLTRDEIMALEGPALAAAVVEHVFGLPLLTPMKSIAAGWSKPKAVMYETDVCIYGMERLDPRFRPHEDWSDAMCVKHEALKHVPWPKFADALCDARRDPRYEAIRAWTFATPTDICRAALLVAMEATDG